MHPPYTEKIVLHNKSSFLCWIYQNALGDEYCNFSIRVSEKHASFNKFCMEYFLEGLTKNTARRISPMGGM